VCNYIKLVDVPEMEYYTSKNQGEVHLFNFIFLFEYTVGGAN
jgi:hypothetical protein